MASRYAIFKLVILFFISAKCQFCNSFCFTWLVFKGNQFFLPLCIRKLELNDTDTNCEYDDMIKMKIDPGQNLGSFKLKISVIAEPLIFM